MHRGLISLILMTMVVTATASSISVAPFGPVAFAQPSPHSYSLPARVENPQIDEAHETALLNLVNHERASAGLVPLMPHATIQGAARTHGREMFVAGYLTHLSRDGRSPRDRVMALGVRVRLVGENLAYAADVQAAHAALMASEPHRRNILLAEYRLIGIAVMNGGDNGVIVVEDFSDEGTAFHLPKWWDAPALPTTRNLRHR